MSVLCCNIPDFLLNLTYRTQPELATRPVALLGVDERVCAVSTSARNSGVQREMQPRQAQMRCPDIQLHPLNMQACQDEQSAFLDTLARWELPIETQSWGLAYLDLHNIAHRSDDVQPLAAELGRRLRDVMGESLQPALGWDSGKFTARAATACASPGRMRLVGKQDEVRFLSPLAITLLPLPSPALQQLHWLGIRTLGQFARLPAVAIWQRFGALGKTAQRWAQGRDDRPVRNTLLAAHPPLDVDFDPPTALLHHVQSTLLEAITPHLHHLRDRLEGCRRLHLQLTFVEGSRRAIDITFIEAVSLPERLQAALAHHLMTLNWPGELLRASITIVETAELPVQQLTLLPQQIVYEVDTHHHLPSPLLELAQKLSGRYNGLFFRGAFIEERHPLAERRTQFQPLT